MLKHLLTASCITAMASSAAWAESHSSEGGDDAAMEQEFEITGDAEAGERVFRKCMACHAVGEDAANKIGPVLNGVVGREIASVEDFQYSDALMELEGEWTPEKLQGYLENPREYAPGNKMSFAGLRKEEERDNVIAYLASYNMDGMQEGM